MPGVGVCGEGVKRREGRGRQAGRQTDQLLRAGVNRDHRIASSGEISPGSFQLSGELAKCCKALE